MFAILVAILLLYYCSSIAILLLNVAMCCYMLPYDCNLLYVCYTLAILLLYVAI
jgi:hypothetical protein